MEIVVWLVYAAFWLTTLIDMATGKPFLLPWTRFITSWFETMVDWLRDALTRPKDPLDWDEVRRLSNEYGLPFPEDYLADGLKELERWYDRTPYDYEADRAAFLAKQRVSIQLSTVNETRSLYEEDASAFILGYRASVRRNPPYVITD